MKRCPEGTRCRQRRSLLRLQGWRHGNSRAWWSRVVDSGDQIATNAVGKALVKLCVHVGAGDGHVLRFVKDATLVLRASQRLVSVNWSDGELFSSSLSVSTYVSMLRL